MKVEDIVKIYLIGSGYDGLCSPEQDCGCGFYDFMPCGGEGVMDCIAAYKHSNGLYYQTKEGVVK